MMPNNMMGPAASVSEGHRVANAGAKSHLRICTHQTQAGFHGSLLSSAADRVFERLAHNTALDHDRVRTMDQSHSVKEGNKVHRRHETKVG